MQNNNGKIFKSIILSNAENLTNDAQSALRRCIETFSHNTRFFIVIEDIEKILSPILSRFCNIYIPYPKINKKKTNLYNLNKFNNEKNKKIIKKYFKNIESVNVEMIQNIVDELYLKGISGLDIIDYIKEVNDLENSDYLFFFEKIKKEFRNEKLLMFIYVYYYFMRKKIHLENLVKM